MCAEDSTELLVFCKLFPVFILDEWAEYCCYSTENQIEFSILYKIFLWIWKIDKAFAEKIICKSSSFYLELI